MAELISFADPEQVIVDWANAILPDIVGMAGVRASGRVPSPRPVRFVRVIVTGGIDRDHIVDQPTVVIECWSKTDTDAAAIAQVMRGELLRAGRIGWIGSTPCLSVETLSRPQSLPDPVTAQVRYTATYAVTLRGVSA